MESKTGFCIYCHSAVSYREGDTYVQCKCCHRLFFTALFGMAGGYRQRRAKCYHRLFFTALFGIAGGYRQRRAQEAENICREADKLLASHKFDSAYMCYQELLQGYSDVILTPAEIPGVRFCACTAWSTSGLTTATARWRRCIT